MKLKCGTTVDLATYQLREADLCLVDWKAKLTFLNHAVKGPYVHVQELVQSVV